ncbi:MAG: DUF5615 family PIN-like protein [Spirosomataceae bacterium]
MKILIDMNLSPIWVDFFSNHNINSVHWANIGDIRASDTTLFDWAKENNSIVFTNDLDFGSILSATNASYPSVIQVRTQNLMPSHIGGKILEILSSFKQQLDEGSLITLDDEKLRVRILPIRKN